MKETGAQRIIATHGYTAIFSDHLRTLGYDACAESTEFAGEGALEEHGLYVDEAEKNTSNKEGG